MKKNVVFVKCLGSHFFLSCHTHTYSNRKRGGKGLYAFYDYATSMVFAISRYDKDIVIGPSIETVVTSIMFDVS